MVERLVERLEEYGFVFESMAWKIKRGLIEVRANPRSYSSTAVAVDLEVDLEVSTTHSFSPLRHVNTFILSREDLEYPVVVRKMVCKLFEGLSTMLIPLCEQVSEAAMTGDI